MVKLGKFYDIFYPSNIRFVVIDNEIDQVMYDSWESDLDEEDFFKVYGNTDIVSANASVDENDITIKLYVEE